MSMENLENAQGEIKKLDDIYQILIHRPQPEEEEAAQRDMVPLFIAIHKKLPEDSELVPLIGDLMTISQNWDPLEFWFIEMSELKEKYLKFLSLFFPKYTIEPKIQKKSSKKESKNDETLEKQEKERLKDINQKRQENQQKINSKALEGNAEEIIQKKIEARLQSIGNKMSKVMKKVSPTIPTQTPSVQQKAHLHSKLKPPVLKIPKIYVKESNKKNPLQKSPNAQDIEKILPEKNQNYKKSPSLASSPEISPSPDENSGSIQIDPKTFQNIQLSSTFHPKFLSIEATVIKSQGLDEKFSFLDSSKSPLTDTIATSEMGTLSEGKDLYQKLIQLEAREFTLKKSGSELGEKLKSGEISDDQFKQTISSNNSELLLCKSKIMAIREQLNMQKKV
ncbi:MAG: hypothetical protein ACTSVU_00355 [Promethearchaeota archaeon]